MRMHKSTNFCKTTITFIFITKIIFGIFKTFLFENKIQFYIKNNLDKYFLKILNFFNKKLLFLSQIMHICTELHILDEDV